MCLIVDINVAVKIFSGKDADFKPVHNALFTSQKQPATLVCGGKLAQEFRKSTDLQRVIVSLERAGRVRIIADGLVEKECKEVERLGLCQSNDEHILALARVADVRLLCTEDGALAVDFCNNKIIYGPRGKVYKRATHRHLIRKFCANEKPVKG